MESGYNRQRGQQWREDEYYGPRQGLPAGQQAGEDFGTSQGFYQRGQQSRSGQGYSQHGERHGSSQGYRGDDDYGRSSHSDPRGSRYGGDDWGREQDYSSQDDRGSQGGYGRQGRGEFGQQGRSGYGMQRQQSDWGYGGSREPSFEPTQSAYPYRGSSNQGQWDRQRGGYGQGSNEEPSFQRQQFEGRGGYGSQYQGRTPEHMQGGEYDYRGDQYSSSRTGAQSGGNWRSQFRSGESSGGSSQGRGGASPMGGDRWWGGATQEDQQRRYGRGPKGYSRSDDRIREEVCDNLMASTALEVDDIEVQVSEGEVTLTGNVCCRSDKYTAEDIAHRALGVSDVINQLRVKRSDSKSENKRKSDDSSEQGSSNLSSDKKKNRTGALT
ncbi:MAG: BON domain-containing protein [Phycisphaerae bacterium]